MSQATESTITSARRPKTSPVRFIGAGRPEFAPPPDAAQAAHAAFVAAIAALTPPRIVGTPDAADVHNRVDHIRAVFRALVRYQQEIVTDTADQLPTAGSVDLGKIDNVLIDAQNEDDDSPYDVVAVLNRMGCHIALRGLVAAE